MAAAVAAARDAAGAPKYNVIGVELDTAKGRHAVESLNAGRFPSETTDPALVDAVAHARSAGNLVATTDDTAYALAEVVIVDIHLDLDQSGEEPSVCFKGLRAAIDTVGRHMKPEALVLVEVTVPPGTCRNVVAPTLAKALAKRDLPTDSFLLAHSYERVMPGAEYFDSIVNYWRVYAGHTPAAADACERFLASVVNTRDYPLTRLSDTVASETAKVLENSYRAATIAFIDEWGQFAEAAGIDLYDVLAAIRKRPTHSNIRQPGFGVGGYCLTKDPLFARFSALAFFERPDLTFPFSRMSVKTNAVMPLHTLHRLEQRLGNLEGKTILLLGVAYRPDVADTRYSPSETFYREARRRGAQVIVHDPLVRFWEELALDVPAGLPETDGVHAIVFAVGHKEYRSIDFAHWLGGQRPLILDANDTLGSNRLSALKRAGHTVESIGRGVIGEQA